MGIKGPAVYSISYKQNLINKERRFVFSFRKHFFFSSRVPKQIMSGENVRKTRRRNNPGVRVVGSRVYDSENGKTCHQCRQKTMDFVALCKNLIENKRCVISYCHKCLHNRYGENAEEVSVLEGWICPRCKGICNCSVCMKKRGCKPTGIMVHTAKRTGYSSVSDLLHVTNLESSSDEIGQHLKESSTNKNSKRKPPIEILNCSSSVEHATQNYAEASDITRKKLKRKGKDRTDVEENKSKLKKIPLDGSRADDAGADGGQGSRKKKIDVLKEVSDLQSNSAEHENESDVTKVKAAKRSRKLHNKEPVAELQLPKLAILETVAGVKLPIEDVGNALQLLEFCGAFGNVLDMKEGQAKSIITELARPRHSQEEQSSPIVQILIQLLTLIHEDKGEKSSSFSPNEKDGSWMLALGKCIAESQCKLEDFPTDCFNLGVDEYYKLESSRKLKLLNFISDESLCTKVMRDCIADQNSKFVAQQKEEKKEAAAAKKKEKYLKQKLRDEIANAILKKEGVPLSIAEHDALVSHVKAEAEAIHVERINNTNTIKKSHRADGVRTEPIAVEANGNALWELEGYSVKPKIIYQDRGATSDGFLGDKWFLFEADQWHELENYVSNARKQRKH